MPRPGPRRPLVAFRLSLEGIEAVDVIAKDRGITRSEAVRLMIGYALRHMPASYKRPEGNVDQ